MVIGIPSIDPSKRPQAKRLQAISEAEIVPSTDGLLMWIRWPAVERRPDYLLLHIDKPCRLELLPRGVLVLDRLVETAGGVFQVVVPLNEIRIRGERVIVATRLQVDFDLLYPSVSGFEMSGDRQHWLSRVHQPCSCVRTCRLSDKALASWTRCHSLVGYGSGPRNPLLGPTQGPHNLVVLESADWAGFCEVQSVIHSK